VKTSNLLLACLVVGLHTYLWHASSFLYNGRLAGVAVFSYERI